MSTPTSMMSRVAQFLNCYPEVRWDRYTNDGLEPDKALDLILSAIAKRDKECIGKNIRYPDELIDETHFMSAHDENVKFGIDSYNNAILAIILRLTESLGEKI